MLLYLEIETVEVEPLTGGTSDLNNQRTSLTRQSHVRYPIYHNRYYFDTLTTAFGPEVYHITYRV